MNTSQQASGGRHLAPLVSGYPWRAIIIEQHSDGEWRRLCVFECETEEDATEAAFDTCTEPYDDGVIAMHFYVGEVAHA